MGSFETSEEDVTRDDNAIGKHAFFGFATEEVKRRELCAHENEAAECPRLLAEDNQAVPLRAGVASRRLAYSAMNSKLLNVSEGTL